MNQTNHTASPLRIGWSQKDITPAGTVLIAGQFHNRVSEGVDDPLSATAMAIDNGQDHAVLVSVEVVSVPQDVIADIQRRLADVPGLDPARVIINATHTHTAPSLRLEHRGEGSDFAGPGIDLGVDLLPVETYRAFFASQVADAVREAWERRAPGSLAYGFTHAVIGRNRRWVSHAGVSTMYGNTATADFSHIEGYEDPSINILGAWDDAGRLTGVLLNVACPSQVSEHLFTISADYWHETRQAIRQRHGQGVYVLAQCSAAGDQAPRPIWGKAAEERMLRLKGRTQRQELAHRLAQAVDDVLPHIQPVAASEMVLRHEVRTLELPVNQLTQKDVDDALASAAEHWAEYEAEKARIEADPAIRQQPHWYVNVTRHHRRAGWYRGVAERYQHAKDHPTLPVTLHVVRLGDMVMATNPFEYYLDYGIRIKAQSPFEQTFLVQLAGHGTYVPSERSVGGGGYGSVPASNPIGPQGGIQLCEATVMLIQELHD